MDVIKNISELSGESFANQILIIGFIFAAFWYTDHKTHLRIWKNDITDGELRTHRMILYASYGLMASLVLMRWFPLLSLPLFFGCWFTRTLHEVLDELHWHMPRCTERETLIHLAMYITIQTGTFLTFMWGFFLQYRGIENLSIFYQLAFGGLILIFGYIGHHEIFDYKSRH